MSEIIKTATIWLRFYVSKNNIVILPTVIAVALKISLYQRSNSAQIITAKSSIATDSHW